MAYSKEKLQKILDSLVDGTRSGYIKWTLENSMFNSDTRHKMEYISDDGLTTFSMDVTLEDDLLSLSGSTKSLRIHNDDLVDDGITVSGYDFKDTKVLCELIYKKFLRPSIMNNLPKTGVLDDILGNINKQHMRQEKIDDILSDDDIQIIEDEAKALVEKRIKEAKEGTLKPKVVEVKQSQSKKKKWWQF